jgi:EAL domain-containing protein (putative c-di-GMP-specific phosphodiesterase class I)
MPFDTIKIGKTFISEMLIDSRAESCVLAMIWLGHGLGIEMVADGVESLDVADRLAKMGCHFAQGFLYAHPVPASEVAVLLSESAAKGRLEEMARM